MTTSKDMNVIFLLFFVFAILLTSYFVFSAVYGDNGILRRLEIEAELQNQYSALQNLNVEVTEMENLTERLSDSYLDLDLLDEQARSILGLIGKGEIIVPLSERNEIK